MKSNYFVFMRFGLLAALVAAGAPAGAQTAQTTISATTVADTALADRRASLKRMGAAKYIDNSYQKTKSYDVLAATALHGCGPVEWPEYMASLSTLEVVYPPDGPMEMFALPPLVRYLYQFGHCMTDQQKQRLLSGFTSQKEMYFGHGTINHAIMRAASWYLLAQYFPKAKWADWDGKVLSSSELMAELKRLMAGRTARYYQSGYLEWLSPTYELVNLFPLLNLIDYAQDPEVKARAEKEATLQMAVLKVNSFHGTIVPPLTRKNFDQRNALDTPQNYVPSITQHALWYYFGEPAGFGLYDFQSRTEPFYASMLGLSNWRPPSVLNEIQQAGPYAIQTNTPRFGIWDEAVETEIFGDSYIAGDYAIGTGNLLFDPDGYSGHIQTFGILVDTDKALNQIECYHPYWMSNSGEDAWGTDRSSPFQQMYRYDDSSVVMLFDIPARDPWVFPENRFFEYRKQRQYNLFPLAQCRIPRNFDQIITLQDRVYIRQGNVFIAIATLHGRNEFDQAPRPLVSRYVIQKIREPKTALFFRVDRARPDFDFAQFQQSIKDRLPEYDSARSSVRFVDNAGVKTEVTFKIGKAGKRWAALPEVIRNGRPLVRDGSRVIESNVLTLRGGKLDFRSTSPANHNGSNN